MGEYGKTIDIHGAFFRELSDDTAILQQALEMRMQTKRGYYWDDPEYGLLIDDYLNEGLTQDALVRVASEIKAQCEADERVNSAAVTPNVTAVEGGYELKPEVMIFPRTGTPFSFVLPVTKIDGPMLRKQA